MVIDQLTPRSPENSVLGSLFIEPKLTGRTISQLRDSDFLNGRARLMWQTICQLYSEGTVADPALVAGKLSSICPDIGSSIRDCMLEVITASNIWEYVAAVKEQGRLAQLQMCGFDLRNAGNMDEAQNILAKAQGLLVQKQRISRMDASEMLENFRQRHQSGKKPEYLSWSIPKLDNGLYTEAGDFVILGGYPSAGKTALALRFAWHMAETKRVAFYSFETRTSKLADRLIATLAEIDLGAIKRNTVATYKWDRLRDMEDTIKRHQLTMVQAAGMTVQDIQADALENRYDVVFIDYLQLISTPKVTNRVEAVTGISLGLHQIAQANNITIVALSQLRRPDTGKGTGVEAAPTMSSLRESGQLEQDADTIMLIYRERPEDPKSRRILKIAKNKEGEIGKIYLNFDGATQTFSADKEQADNPDSRYRQMEWRPGQFCEYTDEDAPPEFGG